MNITRRLTVAFFAVVFSALTWAQGLTTAQLATLAAHIRANTDPAVVAALANGADNEIARLYNLDAVPAFVVWRTNVTNDELGDAMNGTEVAGLSSLNMQRLQVLAAYSGGSQNMSRADRRSAFDQVFSGAGGATTRAAMAVLWKRNARLVEKVFATGTGSTGSPATLVYEGTISGDDVSRALRP